MPVSNLVEIGLSLTVLVTIVAIIYSSSEGELNTDNFSFKETTKTYTVEQASILGATPIAVANFPSEESARKWIDREKKEFQLTGGIYYNSSTGGYLNIIETPFFWE